MEICALKLVVGFRQQFVHLPSYWIVCEGFSFFQYPTGKGFGQLAQNDNHLESIKGSIIDIQHR